MHSLEARPKAYVDTRRKRIRPHRAHLHSHAVHNSILVVFPGNDLLALMLNCLRHSALVRRRSRGDRPTVLGIGRRGLRPSRFRSRRTRDPTIAATAAVARLWMFHSIDAIFPFDSSNSLQGVRGMDASASYWRESSAAGSSVATTNGGV